MVRVFFIVLLTALSFFNFGQGTIRLTNGEWEPYLSKGSYQYGLASHIVEKAFALEGIGVEWGFFPWVRSYNLAKVGVWDGSAIWWKTLETQSDFYLSDKILDSSLVFFHLKTFSFQWNSFQDLEGLKIGVTRGYDYGEEFTKARRDKIFEVLEVSTDEQLYKLLLSKRIDLMPNDKVVGYAQIKNSLDIEEQLLFTHNPKAFGSRSLHLILSKDSAKGLTYLELFNRGLSKLRLSGEIDGMIEDLKSGLYDKK